MGLKNVVRIARLAQAALVERNAPKLTQDTSLDPEIARVSKSTNPYAAQSAADQGIIAKNQAQSQARMGQLQGQASKYPSYPNQFNLGDTSKFEAQATPGSSAPGFAGNTVTAPGDNAGAQSFNPWSLQGEANARNG